MKQNFLLQFEQLAELAAQNVVLQVQERKKITLFDLSIPDVDLDELPGLPCFMFVGKADHTYWPAITALEWDNGWVSIEGVLDDGVLDEGLLRKFSRTLSELRSEEKILLADYLERELSANPNAKNDG